MDDLLTTSNLGHTFGKSWLFRHLELHLKKQDRLVILGPNGSGKSTLLKCLSGLISPREGSIKSNVKIGYASLDLALYPNLTALEHLELASRLKGTLLDISSLETVGLTYATHQFAGEFSTGMRARLKLALALSSSPEILMLDEPSAAMDEKGREIIQTTVENFPGAVVLATNDHRERRWATHEIEIS